MNRALRTILGVILILIIAFAGISICQNTGKRLKWDVTDQKIYTLSDGTKAILNKLNQPITAKLYYAKTASLKGPDQIRFFTNYYEFVKALLEEYQAVSNGKVKLEVIDPRPFSVDEENAIKYGLKRFPISQEENFFFGLVVQTPFGVEKSIPFFSPDRQNFVEYDISDLIDSAITRQKKVIGVMSSMPVMGDDVSDYMARMMAMQGQETKQPWTFIEHLKKQYEVKSVPTDANDINDVDLLLVIQPKDLPEKTRFAIDQYVVKGGRTIICVDPYCYSDRPEQPPGMQQAPPKQNSNLPALLKTWGLEMPDNTFAGDMNLALLANAGQGKRPQKLIGYLGLTKDCFNQDNVMTSELNDVKMPFVGVLNEIPISTDPNDPNAPALMRTPLVRTTAQGNTWKISSPYELAYMNPERLAAKFTPGTKPVTLAYLLTGRFKSSFPHGITVDVQQPDPNDPNETMTVQEKRTGLTEGTQDGAVVVFADADFISDGLAYQNSFFGKMVIGDNSALMLNTIDGLMGSSELISIRSRGNFKRPFTLVDRIEQEADKATAEEVTKLNAIINGYNMELQNLVSGAKEGEEDVIGSQIVKKRRDLEVKISQAKRQLNEVKLKRRERIEALGNRLRQWNMLAAPAVILGAALLLGIRRSMRKRHYISHASDA